MYAYYSHRYIYATYSPSFAAFEVSLPTTYSGIKEGFSIISENRATFQNEFPLFQLYTKNVWRNIQFLHFFDADCIFSVHLMNSDVVGS